MRESVRPLKMYGTDQGAAEDNNVLHSIKLNGKEYHYWLRPVGSGGFGTVHKGYQVLLDPTRGQTRGIDVAVKIVSKEKLSTPELAQRMREEKRLHAALRHENIVRMLDAGEDREGRSEVIVMEYCAGGDLRREQQRKGTYSEEETRVVVGQLVEAIRFLHDRRIMHRDIKLANVLIHKDELGKKTYKLADFGLATVWKSDGAAGRGALGGGGGGGGAMQHTVCGTFTSMPPEMPLGAAYSEQIDLWELGVVMYTLLVGREPFEAQNADYRAIVKNISHATPKYPSHLSGDALKLLNGLLQHEADRFSLQDVLESEFLRGKSVFAGEDGGGAGIDSGLGTATTFTASSMTHSHNSLGHRHQQYLHQPAPCYNIFQDATGALGDRPQVRALQPDAQKPGAPVRAEHRPCLAGQERLGGQVGEKPFASGGEQQRVSVFVVPGGGVDGGDVAVSRTSRAAGHGGELERAAEHDAAAADAEGGFPHWRHQLHPAHRRGALRVRNQQAERRQGGRGRHCLGRRGRRHRAADGARAGDADADEALRPLAAAREVLRQVQPDGQVRADPEGEDAQADAAHRGGHLPHHGERAAQL